MVYLINYDKQTKTLIIQLVAWSYSPHNTPCNHTLSPTLNFVLMGKEPSRKRFAAFLCIACVRPEHPVNYVKVGFESLVGVLNFQQLGFLRHLCVQTISNKDDITRLQRMEYTPLSCGCSLKRYHAGKEKIVGIMDKRDELQRLIFYYCYKKCALNR